MSHTATNDQILEFCKLMDGLVKELVANTALPTQLIDPKHLVPRWEMPGE